MGQLRAVVLVYCLQHALQNDPLRRVYNPLFCGEYLNAVGFELALVYRAVVAIARKSVQLVHNDRVKRMAPAIRDHALKLRALVCRAAECPVDILPDNGNPLRLCKSFALMELPLDGLLCLPVTAVSCIYNRSHVFVSSMYSTAPLVL